MKISNHEVRKLTDASFGNESNQESKSDEDDVEARVSPIEN